jgi:hypothetical protein
MGDLVDGHSCDAFICAFAEDVVQMYRSPFLDKMFGANVRYYVRADDNWEVHLYVTIQTGETDEEGEVEEHFRVEGARPFFPTSDDIVSQVTAAFSITPEEAEERLESGSEEAERERERAWQETLAAMAAGGDRG